MKEKIFTIRENFKFDDVEQRNGVVRENIIRIIKNELDKEALRAAKL